jgi:hypothetical protein
MEDCIDDAGRAVHAERASVQRAEGPRYAATTLEAWKKTLRTIQFDRRLQLGELAFCLGVDGDGLWIYDRNHLA